MNEIVKRLLENVKINSETGCWLWQGKVDRDGYPVLDSDGTRYRMHRMAYSEFVGPIPSGMNVCHACDVPSCVYPLHLWVGTHADNVADRNAKGRQAKGPTHYSRTCPERLARGERQGSAKLTGKDVLEIRRLRRETRLDYKTIAGMFRVSHRTVAKAALGVTWKHLEK